MIKKRLFYILFYSLCGSFLLNSSYASYRYLGRDHSNMMLQKFSYIGSIDLPEEQLKWANDFISKVNSTIRYPVIKRDGYRQITISVRKMYTEETNEAKIGLAVTLPFSCMIYLDPSIFEDQSYFEEVFSHELLHCFGYDHSPNPTDVMNAYRTTDVSSFTQFYYYREIAKNQKAP